MAEVPEDQKIDRVLETRWNQGFADIADRLNPSLVLVRRRPQRVVDFSVDPTSYFGFKTVQKYAIETLHQQHLARGDSVIVDFGLHMVGRLSFKIVAEGLNIDAPCRMRLTFGETPFDVTEGMDNVKTWISTSWLPDEIINVDDFPEIVRIPRRHACRFIRFDITDTSPKYSVSLSEIEFATVSCVDPSLKIERFDFGDKLLNKIDHASISTLRDCMQSVFEDGPRRDRRLWIGDLRLQALTNYCTIKDYNLVKRCIFMFAALIREDGSLPACLFEKPTLRPATDYIVDYDALFAVIVCEYVEASGDVENGKLLWPTIRSCLLRAISHVNPQTHAFEHDRGTGWKFLDWSRDLDRSAGLHGLLLFCVKAADKLAHELSMKPEFERLTESLIIGARSFYDPSQKLIVSGPTRQVSLASAAWMVLSGGFSREQSRSIMQNTLGHTGCVMPTTPYLWHYVCEALTSIELYDECLDLIRSYWGAMIEAGADTFWECFDKVDARLSPYGDVRNNSFCHAWSCTPSYLLRRKLGAYLKPKCSWCTMRDLDETWISSQVNV